MSKVTLNRALKLKNRQVQKLNELKARISASNSLIVGSKPEFDNKALLQDYLNESEKLWRLKAAINGANAAIQPAIYEMAELKATVAWLRRVDTRSGPRVEGYGQSAPTEYFAQITQGELLNRVDELERRIDALQDELDRHNATHEIDIDL